MWTDARERERRCRNDAQEAVAERSRPCATGRDRTGGAGEGADPADARGFGEREDRERAGTGAEVEPDQQRGERDQVEAA